MEPPRLSEMFLCFMSVHPLSTVPLPDWLLWQIQSAVILLSSESELSLRFDIVLNFISYGVLMNYQNNIVFVFMCPIYCPLLFVFACGAVSVSTHLAVDSAC